MPDRIATRAASFSAVGIVNGVVGISVIALAGWLGVAPIPANVLGYGAGLAVSFSLNSRLTFRSRSVDRGTVVRFLAAFAVSFAANLGVVAVSLRALPAHGLIASLLGTPLYAAMFYLLCEYWVFRRPPDAGRSASSPRIPPP